MTAPPSPSTSTIRQFEVTAASAPVFGRVLMSARNHHFIVDGPVYNGCLGEAIIPPELFLSAVASCGVELMHVIARDENIPLQHAAITIEGLVDREKQARTDRTVFNKVHLRCTMKGITRAQGSTLVEGFKKRCPIYGTVASGAVETVVDFEVE